MRVVYKYPLQPGPFTLDLPAGAEVLRAGHQPASGGVFLWAAVDPAATLEHRRFFLCATGQRIDHAKDLRFIDTIFLESATVVLHLFEVIQVEDL